MKKNDAIFENILMGITAFLCIAALLAYDLLLVLMLWLLPLGGLQVLHSFVIGISYWKNKRIRTAICIYWLAASLDLTMLFFPVDSYAEVDPFYWFLVYIPLFIAAYLWFITWHFRNETITIEEGQARQNQVTQ